MKKLLFLITTAFMIVFGASAVFAADETKPVEITNRCQFNNI